MIKHSTKPQERRSKKISFIMPSLPYAPIGGFKVVYEYANRFARDGYDVSIIYPVISYWKNKRIATLCKLFVKHAIGKLRKTHRFQNWFALDPSIKEISTFSLYRTSVPRADVYIATAAQTAKYVNAYPKKSQKIYFIQHFENWVFTDDEVINTYHYPLTKIVIARWLAEILQQAGEKCFIVHNGFDFDYFTLVTPIKKRDKYRIAMLYHTLEWKGCDDGFEALSIVKQKYPELEVSIFGTDPRPEHLPDWYDYHCRPDRLTHNKIYNEAAIFLGTSHSEGWGLTVGEAMMCGCAVVCTDNPGYREMATQGETALVSPIRSPHSLAENIIRLIEKDDLRYEIATAGNRHIQQFKWEKSYKLFEQIVNASIV